MLLSNIALIIEGNEFFKSVCAFVYPSLILKYETIKMTVQGKVSIALDGILQ